MNVLSEPWQMFAIDSPAGWWSVTTTETHVLSVDYHGEQVPDGVKTTPESRLEQRLHCMLSRYFKGEPVAFERVPVFFPEKPVTVGQVMRALQTIPRGEVRSYQWVAEAIGNIRATRAVGGALGRNPVPIIIPCHRVIAKHGGLGGFMRNHPDGSRVKTCLLSLEGYRFARTGDLHGQLPVPFLAEEGLPSGSAGPAGVSMSK